MRINAMIHFETRTLQQWGLLLLRGLGLSLFVVFPVPIKVGFLHCLASFLCFLAAHYHDNAANGSQSHHDVGELNADLVSRAFHDFLTESEDFVRKQFCNRFQSTYLMYAGISSVVLYFPVQTSILRSRLSTLCVPVLIECGLASDFGASEDGTGVERRRSCGKKRAWGSAKDVRRAIIPNMMNSA